MTITIMTKFLMMLIKMMTMITMTIMMQIMMLTITMMVMEIGVKKYPLTTPLENLKYFQKILVYFNKYQN